MKGLSREGRACDRNHTLVSSGHYPQVVNGSSPWLLLPSLHLALLLGRVLMFFPTFDNVLFFKMSNRKVEHETRNTHKPKHLSMLTICHLESFPFFFFFLILNQITDTETSCPTIAPHAPEEGCCLTQPHITILPNITDNGLLALEPSLRSRFPPLSQIALLTVSLSKTQSNYFS